LGRKKRGMFLRAGLDEANHLDAVAENRTKAMLRANRPPPPIDGRAARGGPTVAQLIPPPGRNFLLNRCITGVDPYTANLDPAYG
jgi:hypothetical protein